MRSKTVSSGELTSKTLRAKDYVPDDVPVTIYESSPGAFYIDDDIDPQWVYHVKIPREFLKGYKCYRKLHERMMQKLSQYYKQQTEPEL